MKTFAYRITIKGIVTAYVVYFHAADREAADITASGFAWKHGSKYEYIRVMPASALETIAHDGKEHVA